MPIWFAVDGAVHADWLSHFALRFARRSASRTLHLLHVAEPEPLPAAVLERRVTLARRYGVTVAPVELPPGRDVASRLLAAGIVVQVAFSYAVLYVEPVAHVLATGPVPLGVYALGWLGIPLIFGADALRKRMGWLVEG